MLKIIIAILMIIPFVIIAQEPEKTNSPVLGKAAVKEIVSAMTLEEKLNFIKGTGMKITTAGGDAVPIAGSMEGSVPGAAGSTFAIPRLGIPAIILADGPAGLRIDSMRIGDTKRYYSTAFPIGTSLASTWNTELLFKVGQSMGNEVKEYGVDIILGPAVNMHRNPLGGRNYEYFSEDPLISGKIAAALINGVQSNGVGTSVKHFAVNDQETNRNNVDAIISERAAREIYLKPFEIAVKESSPWTIMSSYNKINGTYASENYELLTTILRDEWKFNGVVMTDWFAGKNYPAQVRAGNDLLMPGRKREAELINEAITAKKLSMEELDRNVENILNLILKTPKMENYRYTENPDLEEHARIVREAGAEGCVLLKNSNKALPAKEGKIALLGNSSYDLFIGGTGSGEVYKAYTVSLYQGLNDAGYLMNTKLTDDYLSYIQKEKAARPARKSILETIKPIEEHFIGAAELEKLATENDAAIITIGRNAGEGSDRKLEFDYYFTPRETELLETTSKAFHDKGKKVIVVLNIDAVVDVVKWRDLADAILVVWQPGQEAGHSIADVISGKVNPSGKLATTFPMKYNDVPSAKSFPGTPAERPTSTVYNEGIYVGYRYYTTFGVEPAYGFGYGLSYTTFQFGKLKVDADKTGESINVEVEVTNKGDVAGKEVVQLYISAPEKSMDKPEIELKAFAKTNLLQPGEKQKMRFGITAADLASFDSTRSAWLVEPGKYKIRIGTSCKNILLEKSFSIKKELVTGKANKSLVLKQEFNEMRAPLK